MRRGGKSPNSVGLVGTKEQNKVMAGCWKAFSCRPIDSEMVSRFAHNSRSQRLSCISTGPAKEDNLPMAWMRDEKDFIFRGEYVSGQSQVPVISYLHGVFFLGI